MRRRIAIFLFTVALASLSGWGMLSTGVAAGKDGKSATQNKSADGEGERIFQKQCSRCHAAPQMLPATAVKTIVRHMRTRANLTAEQERALLEYIAP